jgi:hypothetical protein
VTIAFEEIWIKSNIESFIIEMSEAKLRWCLGGTAGLIEDCLELSSQKAQDHVHCPTDKEQSCPEASL